MNLYTARKYVSAIALAFVLMVNVCIVWIPTAQAADSSTIEQSCAITSAADKDAAIKVAIPIPGVTKDFLDADNNTYHAVKNMSCYIAGFYRYFAGVAGILSVVMMIYGGYQYVVSFGNTGKIGQAKDTIISAMLGLAITLGSYAILNFINPNLVSLKLPGMPDVKTRVINSYKGADGNCLPADQIPCGLTCINSQKTPSEVVRGTCSFCAAQDPSKTCGQQRMDASLATSDGNCVYARCATYSGTCVMTPLTSLGEPDFLNCEDGITVSGTAYGYEEKKWNFSGSFPCGELHWKKPFLSDGFGVIGKSCPSGKYCVINNRDGLTLTVRNSGLQDEQLVGSFDNAQCY